MTTTIYRVETQAVRVEVSFGFQSRAVGEMFLRPSIISASGIESIMDRMNDREAFFPLRVAEPTQATVLIGKSQVRFVACNQVTPEAGDHDTDRIDLGMTIELDDATELSGTFHAELPRGKRRALDFINSELGLFVPFFVGSKQYVINRSFIRRLHDGMT